MNRTYLLLLVVATAALVIVLGVSPEAWSEPFASVDLEWAAIGGSQKSEPMPLPWLVAMLQAFFGVFLGTIWRRSDR